MTETIPRPIPPSPFRPSAEDGTSVGSVGKVTVATTTASEPDDERPKDVPDRDEAPAPAAGGGVVVGSVVVIKRVSVVERVMVASLVVETTVLTVLLDEWDKVADAETAGDD